VSFRFDKDFFPAFSIETCLINFHSVKAGFLRFQYPLANRPIFILNQSFLC
jgi:hypothetical protein